jgi:hypothetical protein
MSVSTDGILTFGVDLGEEPEDLPWQAQTDLYDDDDEDEEDIGFEEWLYITMGVSSATLWNEYYEWARGWKTGDYAHDNEGVKAYEKLHPEWRVKLDKSYEEQHKVEKECPIELITHCSGEYPMYIVALRGHTTKAWRGSPEVIESLNVDERLLSEAKIFCNKYGIPFDDPKWLLASYWG